MNKFKNLSDAARLAYVVENFSCDPNTGVVLSKSRRRGAKSAICGGKPNINGYIRMKILGETIQIHRVIYAICHKEWPHLEIDHINGIKSDNRLSNLRQATREMNQQNRVAAQSSSALGVQGVSWHKGRKRFFARIQYNGKRHFLGSFKTLEEASSAYLEAKRINHSCFRYEDIKGSKEMQNMTYTPQAQRLMKLARRAGDLEFEAYMEFKRERAYHFMRKMYRLTQLAIQAQHGA